MIISVAHSKSVPFPQEGFQKWDVITPTDSNHYGKLYTITDYRCDTYDNGNVKYYYTLSPHIGFGTIYVSSLEGYEKLYSKRRDIILNIRKDLKIKMDDLLEYKENIDKNLGIDDTLLIEGINKIEEFYKMLEYLR